MGLNSSCVYLALLSGSILRDCASRVMNVKSVGSWFWLVGVYMRLGALGTGVWGTGVRGTVLGMLGLWAQGC